MTKNYPIPMPIRKRLKYYKKLKEAHSWELKSLIVQCEQELEQRARKIINNFTKEERELILTLIKK